MIQQNIDIGIFLSSTFGLIDAYKYVISIFTITTDVNPIKYKFNASELLEINNVLKTPL